MDRKEFLAQVGMGTALILGLGCLGACKKSSDGSSSVPVAPTNVDFTVDLNAASSVNLATPGGFIYNIGIIIARTLTGSYLAVSQVCTHEGATVQYDKTNKQFSCPSHGAKFTETGAVAAGPATKALKQYNTALTGNLLKITG